MILFDLDGTLVDTAPDLAYALNLQRERHGLEALPLDLIRPFASHGSKGLLKIGFNLQAQDAAFESMRTEYLNLYDEVFARSPVLFDGIHELLSYIEANNIPWGIVTNKPRRFSAPLLSAMGLDARVACLVCGDDAALPKPAPDTLLMACQQTKVEPAHCFYVGDAARDIEAGNAAGMQTVVALYGYLDDTDQPMEWGANFSIQHPAELIPLISK
jgi:2-phosphoglycolate phosphatase